MEESDRCRACKVRPWETDDGLCAECQWRKAPARPSRLTLAMLKSLLKDIGLTVKRTGFGSELRVSNPKLRCGAVHLNCITCDRCEERQEATAYYTENLEDALNTGVEMARRGAW